MRKLQQLSGGLRMYAVYTGMHLRRLHAHLWERHLQPGVRGLLHLSGGLRVRTVYAELRCRCLSISLR